MTNNNEVLTVGELKRRLENVPDETAVWVFNETESTFAVVVDTTHDKRQKGFNLWTIGP